MINKIFLIIALFFVFTSGSIGNENKINPDIIADYIQVWGFIKYYQISESTKCPNMDSLFLSHINKLLSTNGTKKYNKIIGELLNKYKNFQSLEGLSQGSDIDDKSFAISPDFSWIENSIFLSNKNTKILKRILNYETKEPNCYLSQVENDQQISFINETNTLKPFPRIETRILSIAKYWNMVYYFFAYKDLLSTDWNSILPQYITKVFNTKNSEDYHLLILELTVLLEDSHVNTKSFVLDVFWGVYQIPVRITNFADKVIVTTRYLDNRNNNPFKIGDQLLSVNGKIFSEGYRQVEHLIPGSNKSRKKYNYCKFFPRVANKNSIRTLIIREQDTLEIECLPIHILELKSYKAESYFLHSSYTIYNDSIGYIDLSQVSENDLYEVFTELMNTKYLIIDIRKYPNLILDSLASYLFNKPIAFSNWYSPFSQKPGYFVFRPPITIGNENDNTYQGKIVILVNSGSQSRAEFFTMALQKVNNSVTVGSQTSGADGNVTKFPLPGSIHSSFSGLGIQYPNGDQTQKNGIRIDIEFLPTGDLVRKYRDEELEFVISQIHNQSITNDN